MSETFSHTTREDCAAIRVREKCCRTALFYGVLFGGSMNGDRITPGSDVGDLAVRLLSSLRDLPQPETEGCSFPASLLPPSLLAALNEGTEIPLSDRTLFVCEHCAPSFLRGVFLSCGTVTEPELSYHLELMTGTRQRTEVLKSFLSETIGHEPKTLKRRGRNAVSLYYKDSTSMEDFLDYIGAQKAAFTIMNVKILKDLKNNANRHANCDAANIGKTVAAAQNQIDAIVLIGDAGKADELPKELRETFDLRAAYPEASLTELASMHSQKISRSGVTHRLAKIVEFADRIRQISADEKKEEKN